MELQKKESVNFAAKAIVYVMISLTCAFAMAGAALLDLEMGQDFYFFDPLVKCFIIFGILAYASLTGKPINTPGSKVITPWLLVALIPFLSNFIDYFCIPDHMPSLSALLIILVNMVSTAAWEELFFRYVGQSLFERNGKYTIGAVLLLSLTFGCTHLINIIFSDPVTVLLSVLHASISGIFWLALYRHTGSLWVTFAGHTLQNLIAAFFGLFPEADMIFYTPANYILVSIIMLAISIYILKKHKYIEK